MVTMDSTLDKPFSIWYNVTMKRNGLDYRTGNSGGRTKQHGYHDSHYANHLLRQYGLTIQQYNRIWWRQKGKCAVCGKKKRLVVDHNHKTNKVRGLLCNKCNSGLGLFDDSTKKLSQAIKYLTSCHL